MPQRRFRTNYWIWTVSSFCVFVGLGFVNHLAGVTSKSDGSLWSLVGILIRQEYVSHTSDVLLGIAILAIVPAIAGVIIGWVIHALVVITWSVIRGGTVSANS